MVTQDRVLVKYLEKAQGEHAKRKERRDKRLGGVRKRTGRKTRRSRKSK